MYWIEQHSNPKILKLGIKFALYREKKRIAYLKGSEFRVGDKVWILELNTEWLITELNSGGRYTLKSTGKPGFITSSTTLYQIESNECSHYYPGQQAESFKYVQLQTVVGTRHSKYGDEEQEAEFWQEVEEPYKENGKYLDYSIKNAKTFEEEYTQFKKAVDKGKILAEI